MAKEGFAIISDETFSEEVLDSKLPVLVEFWAENSPLCKRIDSALEKLATDYQNRLKLVRINAGQCHPQKWLAQYKIEKVPTLILFKDGQAQCREEYEADHPVHKFCLLLRKGIDSCLRGKLPISLEFLKFQEYEKDSLCRMDFRIILRGDKVIKSIKLKATSPTFAAPKVKEIKEPLYDKLELNLNPEPSKKGIALIDLEIECQDVEGTQFGLRGETWIYIKDEKRESAKDQKVIFKGKIIGSDLSNLMRIIEGEQKGEDEIEVKPKWEPVDLFLDYMVKPCIQPPGELQVCDAGSLICRTTGKKFILCARPLVKFGRMSINKETGEKPNDFVLRVLPPGAPQNDCRSRRISKGHFQLKLDKGQFLLKSWNHIDNKLTRNGTFIKDQRMPENKFIPLKSGTEIDIAGELQLKFTALYSPHKGNVDCARLERVNNYGEKEEYIIIVREVSIGSAKDNCMVIEGLSPHQAKIYYYAGGFWMENKAAPGEVSVEGEQTKSELEPNQPFALKKSLKIRLGEQLFDWDLP